MSFKIIFTLASLIINGTILYINSHFKQLQKLHYCTVRGDKKPGFYEYCSAQWENPGFTGQYPVILDLMDLLHKKTNFNYFMKSNSVIKWSVTI